MTIENFIATHAAEIDRIRQGLVTDFDTPARRTINAGFARMQEERFDGNGNDLWEMIQCHLNGWEYEKPPSRLIARWIQY